MGQGLCVHFLPVEIGLGLRGSRELGRAGEGRAGQGWGGGWEPTYSWPFSLLHMTCPSADVFLRSMSSFQAGTISHNSLCILFTKQREPCAQWSVNKYLGMSVQKWAASDWEFTSPISSPSSSHTKMIHFGLQRRRPVIHQSSISPAVVTHRPSWMNDQCSPACCNLLFLNQASGVRF